MPTQPAGAPTTGRDADTADADPTERVHHHAKLRDGSGAGGEYTTLCGLRLRPRPEARHMPCCPMCAAEMEVLGQRCTQGPR